LHDLAEEKHKECRDERRMRHEDTLPRPALARRLSMGLKAAVAMGGVQDGRCKIRSNLENLGSGQGLYVN